MIDKEKKYCHFCVNGEAGLDFKNIQTLQRYTSSYAKIVPRRRSGVCSKHQRALAQAIKRSRFMALLPYTAK